MRDIDSLGQVQNKLYFGVDSSGNARSEMQLPKNQAEIYVEVDGLMTQWMDIARTVGTQKLTSVAEVCILWGRILRALCTEFAQEHTQAECYCLVPLIMTLVLHLNELRMFPHHF